MPMMRLCAGCGKIIPAGSRSSSGYKCEPCRKEYERNKSRRRRRTPNERARRQALISRHVAEFGNVCPGWECEPHPATDLTADHLLPVARGGNEEGELQVLCRSCNSRRGAGVASPRSERPEPPSPSFSGETVRDSDAGQSEINDEPLVA
jgi:5-methylcytosine-specific restriction protein A